MVCSSETSVLWHVPDKRSKAAIGTIHVAITTVTCTTRPALIAWSIYMSGDFEISCCKQWISSHYLTGRLDDNPLYQTNHSEDQMMHVYYLYEKCSSFHSNCRKHFYCNTVLWTLFCCLNFHDVDDTIWNANVYFSLFL